MILDWKQQCENILASHRLSRDDPSDNKIYYKQEVIFMRYLICHGLSQEECNIEWLLLQNGVAAQFRDDPEQLDNQFRKTYSKAKSRSYAFVDTLEKLKPITIYDAEIKKINSLHCEKWIKEYVLYLLAYYKFARQIEDAVEYSNTLTNWIIRNIDHPRHKFRSYDDARKNITKTIRDSKFRVIKFMAISGKERYTTYSIPFACNAGEEVVTIKSLENIPRLFSLLRDDYRICPICGTMFDIHSKTKRNLCKLCYTKFRREYKTKKDKEYYYRDK